MNGAHVVRTDRQGKPFALQNRYGKGTALYFESALTLAYFKRSSPLVQQWIVNPAVKAQSEASVQIRRGSEKVGFRGLTFPSGLAAVLTNWGAAGPVTVVFKGQFQVADVLSGISVQATHEHGETLATLELPAGAVAILKATPNGH